MIDRERAGCDAMRALILARTSMCFGAARYSRSTARITDRHHPMRKARRAIVVALHRIIEHSLHVRSSWCRLTGGGRLVKNFASSGICG
jgi:alpha-beta hydrolase superfamily lysophospholipase